MADQIKAIFQRLDETGKTILGCMVTFERQDNIIAAGGTHYAGWVLVEDEATADLSDLEKETICMEMNEGSIMRKYDNLESAIETFPPEDGCTGICIELLDRE